MKEKEGSNLDYIENAVNYLKAGQYGAALNNLYLAKECGYKNNWKKDFGIMLSGDENDSWGNLCICLSCIELGAQAFSSGCCPGYCMVVVGTTCCSLCCTGDIENASTWLAEGTIWLLNCFICGPLGCEI